MLHNKKKINKTIQNELPNRNSTVDNNDNNALFLLLLQIIIIIVILENDKLFSFSAGAGSSVHHKCNSANTALSLPKWTPVQVVTAAPTLSSRIMMCLRVRQNTATAAKTAEEGAYVKNVMARSTTCAAAPEQHWGLLYQSGGSARHNPEFPCVHQQRAEFWPRHGWQPSGHRYGPCCLCYEQPIPECFHVWGDWGSRLQHVPHWRPQCPYYGPRCHLSQPGLRSHLWQPQVCLSWKWKCRYRWSRSRWAVHALCHRHLWGACPLQQPRLQRHQNLRNHHELRPRPASWTTRSRARHMGEVD